MRRIMEEIDRRVKIGAATAGVVLTAGLAGWGGSMIALSGADTTPAAAPSSGAVQARPVGGPATSAPTPSTAPTSATTTQPTASPSLPPSQAASASSSTARRTGLAQTSSAPIQAPAPLPPSPSLDEPDIAFVSPWRDHYSGQWYYRVGLLGFPADTVIEISGDDAYGNVQAAPLAMTTAEGSWNPFAARFVMTFAYGGTCDDAEPATVTARGQGFSVTETAPRPVECDGGATSDGPWTPPISPSPVPTSPPNQGSGGT